MQYTGLVLGPGILLLYNKLARQKAAYTIRLSPEGSITPPDTVQRAKANYF